MLLSETISIAVGWKANGQTDCFRPVVYFGNINKDNERLEKRYHRARCSLSKCRSKGLSQSLLERVINKSFHNMADISWLTLASVGPRTSLFDYHADEEGMRKRVSREGVKAIS